jgi:hypothetical protein
VIAVGASNYSRGEQVEVDGCALSTVSAVTASVKRQRLAHDKNVLHCAGHGRLGARSNCFCCAPVDGRVAVVRGSDASKSCVTTCTFTARWWPMHCMSKRTRRTRCPTTCETNGTVRRKINGGRIRLQSCVAVMQGRGQLSSTQPQTHRHTHLQHPRMS